MNDQVPRVSIGLPVFNGDDYLAEAIESLLAQTYHDFELIISDNASFDDTQRICLAYQAQDERIRYYRNERNVGGALNVNLVFRLARGRYFKWASHDDVCAPQFLEHCVSVLDLELDVVLSYPRTIVIGEAGEVLEYYEDDFNLRSRMPHVRLRPLLGANQLLNPFYGVIRSSALTSTRLNKPYAASDRVLLGELALLGQFHEVQEHLFRRRVHSHKSTESNRTDETLALWFDPTSGGRILLPRWRRFLGFLSAIHRAPLPFADKLRCYQEFIVFYSSPKRLGGAGRDSRQAFRAVNALIARPLGRFGKGVGSGRRGRVQ